MLRNERQLAVPPPVEPEPYICACGAVHSEPLDCIAEDCYSLPIEIEEGD